MNINEFWVLIERFRVASEGDPQRYVRSLKGHLAMLGTQEIIEYTGHLHKCIDSLASFDLLAANFIVQGRVSKETFKDFRAWIIFQGKDRYEKVLQNVETIAEWLEREKVGAINGSEFVALAADAYEEAGGGRDEFYGSIIFPQGIAFKLAWPENKAGFEARWPILCKTFWDDDRIKRLPTNYMQL